MSGLVIILVLWIIVVGLLGVFRPQLLFKIRQPISLTDKNI